MPLTDQLRRAEAPTLSIGYAELGPADGPAVLLLGSDAVARVAKAEADRAQVAQAWLGTSLSTDF